MILSMLNWFQYRIAIETLLETSFVPERTIVLAFGFDEEIGGIRVSTSSALRTLPYIIHNRYYIGSFASSCTNPS